MTRIRFTRRSAALFAAVLALAAGSLPASSAVFTGTSAVASNSVATAFDWIAPVVAIASPADGTRTKLATPTISGTAGITTGDSATVTVRVYAGTIAGGTPTQTLTATRNGSGAWSVATTALGADGTYTVQASQSDTAGNTGTSDAVALTLDTTAPAPVVTAPAAGATTSTAPIISGTAGTATGDGTAITVEVYNGPSATGSPVRTATVTRSGGTWSWTLTPALSNGTYTVQATQADDLANSAKSTAVTFTASGTVDTSLAITAPVGGTTLATVTPAVSGQAMSATGSSATVTLKIYAGAAATGTPVQTQAATRSGSTWSLTVASALSTGVYTLQAEQVDSSANTQKSPAVTITIDVTAPTVTISAPTAAQPVTTTPTIAGSGGRASGDLATMTVAIYAGSTATGTAVQTLTTTRDGASGAWSLVPAALIAGTYTAKATQADAAGNAGSATVTFLVDTVAPTGVSVAALNATGGIAGHLDLGDRVVFTFSEAMAPASMLAGWDGTSTAVTVRFFNGNASDRLSVLNAAATAPVAVAAGTTTSGGLNMKSDFVSATVTFTATMVLSADGKTVTVTLGIPDVPTGIRVLATVAKRMVWSISPSVRDLAGNPAASGTLTETDNDIDF